MANWFEHLTGFAERPYRETQRLLEVDGTTLRSRVNGRSYGIGTLRTPSLAELRAQARPVTRTGSSRVSVSIAQGDVGATHRDPANRNALFQVASQFNLLEMTGPGVNGTAGPGADALAAYIATHGPADRWVVVAFDATVMEHFHAIAPDVPIAPGVDTVTTWFGTRGPLPGYAYLEVPPMYGAIEVVTPKFVADAHAAGLQVGHDAHQPGQLGRVFGAVVVDEQLHVRVGRARCAQRDLDVLRPGTQRLGNPTQRDRRPEGGAVFEGKLRQHRRQHAEQQRSAHIGGRQNRL